MRPDHSIKMLSFACLHSPREGRMLRLVQYFFVGLVVLLPAQALAGSAEEASAVIDRWAAGFNANDAAAVVKLYTADGLLHGTSSPTLNAGASAIGVGFYESAQGASRPARFTFVVVKRGADWLIAHHHSSMLPAARP